MLRARIIEIAMHVRAAELPEVAHHVTARGEAVEGKDTAETV
jgi:hypothetical protein